MKISIEREVAAPAGTVFDEITDFERYEAEAARRGMELNVSPRDRKAEGGWDLVVAWQGLQRRVRIDITRFEPPERIGAACAADGIVAQVDIELRPIDPERCHLRLGVAASAKTLPARLLLKSLSLGRAQIVARLESRLAAIADRAERRAA